MGKTLNSKLEAIRFKFVQSLPMRVGKIESLIQQLEDQWSTDNIAAIMQELHNLRGISGGHGLIIINENAEKIEKMIEAFSANNKALSTNDKMSLHAAVKALIDRMNYIHDTFENSDNQDQDEKYSIAHSKSPLLLVVDDDNVFCETIAAQLEHLGYRTRKIFSVAQLKDSIVTYKPQAIFMDIIFGDNRDAGTQIMKELQEKDGIPCPIIYMSARDDIQARLNAVRSGGSAFLCKAFSLGDLKNILDLIVPLQMDITHKVLIIDDDKISSQYCTAILEHAGIQVSCLNKPENIFEQIINFNPDVILLDMYMPNITGVEMASIVRQHQNFSTIPIVIMSGETDINKQFKMRSAGADDFILKPFKPRHLIDTILNRIQRSRQTKHLIFTDGLTSLMLFSKIRDQITNLLDSCVRYNLDFAVALIDLDHFKTINDTYGHLTGDQILREFAEFLQARVRKSDIVTRSGGEEFTLIFPYTTGANARRAINSFREDFAHRIQHANNKDFKVTFSGGVASIDQYHDLDSLLAAADQALYRAKENGRNATELAT